MPDPVELNLTFQLNDGNQPQVVREWTRTLAPDQLITGNVVLVPARDAQDKTSSYVLDNSLFASADQLLIRNRDTQSAIGLFWERNYNTTTYPVSTFTFEASPDRFRRTDNASIFTGDLAFRPGEFLTVLNSTSNDGTYVVEDVTATLLSLGEGSSFVAGADAAAITISRLSRPRARLSPGGWLMLSTRDLTTDGASPTTSPGNITLVAESAPAYAEIWLFGT